MLDFTTASRDQLKQVYNTIAKLSNDDRFFTTRELDTLPRILSPNEQVLAFSSGAMNSHTWLIVLTDQRVMFVDKGMFWGLTQLSIELSNIVSIEGQTHIMFGTITVSDASTQHKIDNVWKTSVNYFVNKVREAREARRNAVQLFAPGSEGMGPQHADEVRRQPEAAARAGTPADAASATPREELPQADPDEEFWARQRERDAGEPFIPVDDPADDADARSAGIAAADLPTDSIFSVPDAHSTPPRADRGREPPAARPGRTETVDRPIQTRSAPSPTATGPVQVRAGDQAALRRLDRLRASGAMDQASYDAERQKLGL